MAILMRPNAACDWEVYGTRTGKIYKRGTAQQCAVYIKNKKARFAQKLKDDAMASFGLVKVKGALGGTYYE